MLGLFKTLQILIQNLYEQSFVHQTSDTKKNT